jgi:hypothetical protein
VGEGSASRPGRSLPRESPGTHCTGSWVGPKASLDRCRKSRPLPGFDLRTVQPVASRYTNYVTRPTILEVQLTNSHRQWTEVRGQLYLLVALPPIRNQSLIKIEAGWFSKPVWTFRRREKYLCLCRDPSLGMSSPQPSPYTDYTIPVPVYTPASIVNY